MQESGMPDSAPARARSPVTALLFVTLAIPMLLAGCNSSASSAPPPPVLLSNDPALAHLRFLCGHWATDAAADGRRVEEHWTSASAGTMLGVSRTTRSGQTTFFEYLRIEHTPDGTFYVASPGGRGETRFRLVEAVPGRAVFENPEHDFPQRIIYERTRLGLSTRIEGMQRGRERQEQWQYRAARVPHE